MYWSRLDQKMKFCIEHKKVLEIRKDFIGLNREQHSSYFLSKLLLDEPKRYTEYRKYLMEVGDKEKELFFMKHFAVVL